ncbi:hypothetical protein HMSSN036_70500 [Paenibacillus macerans]|nr:hypothetical protein HMSSN036_70500 [Paenibacillus macerans]
MSGYIIETGGLTRRFGERVSVDQLNLRVPEGKIYGFLGANGAGKTTTIRMLLSLIRPDEGTIQIMGARFRITAKPFCEISVHWLKRLPITGIYRPIKILN